MMDLSSLNLYEILDVDPSATPAEIKRAYQIALKTYGTDHMATYGLFTDEERSRILEQIKEAFSILIDPERRRRYDQEMGIEGLRTTEAASDTEELRSRDISPPLEHSGPEVDVGGLSVEKQEELIREVLASAEEMGQWSGEVLKRVREIRGISIDEIADKTKIFRGHLRSIEEDSFDFLPPDVYLKGFITQIAKIIGLDPQYVVPKIMEHIQQKRGPR